MLGVSSNDVAPWLRPVVDAGRDAAFVDTGYIRALLDERDDRNPLVRDFHEGLSASLYTSVLVVAEAARQFAKARGATQDWRWARVDELVAMLVTEHRMIICAPPKELVERGLASLRDMQRTLVRLDLADLVSVLVLDELRHRRVLGFDDHLRAMGASLDPS